VLAPHPRHHRTTSNYFASSIANLSRIPHMPQIIHFIIQRHKAGEWSQYRGSRVTFASRGTARDRVVAGDVRFIIVTVKDSPNTRGTDPYSTSGRGPSRGATDCMCPRPETCIFRIGTGFLNDFGLEPGVPFESIRMGIGESNRDLQIMQMEEVHREDGNSPRTSRWNRWMRG
jgi:hypothetical protein